MAIPKEIRRRHFLLAAIDIDEQREAGTFPPRRASHGWYVELAGVRYPPKYLVSLAGLHATGKKISPYAFNATIARRRLEAEGFTLDCEDSWNSG